VWDEVLVVGSVAGVDGGVAGVVVEVGEFIGADEAHEFEFGVGDFFEENINIFGVFHLVFGDDEVWIFGGGGFDFDGVGLAVDEDGAVAGVIGGGAALGVGPVWVVEDIVFETPFFKSNFPLDTEDISFWGLHFFEVPGHGALVFFVFMEAFGADDVCVF